VRRARGLIGGAIPGRYWLVLAVLYTLAYLYYHWTGKPWTGDSLYYTAMSFDFAGHDLAEAIRLTGRYFHDPEIDRLRNAFDNPALAPLIYPRVVYPALSVPFVLLLGGTGMYVVPLLGSLFVVWGLMRLLTRLFGTAIALGVTGLFIVTVAFLEFVTGLFTESPAMAFTVAIVLMLPLGGRRFGATAAVASAVLLVLITFCRQGGPVLIGAIGCAWLWTLVRRRSLRGNPWNLPLLVLAPVGIASSLVLQWWAPYDVLAWFVQVNGEPDMAGAVRHLPQIYWTLTVTDLRDYFGHDLAMFAIWCAGLISCLVLPLSVRTGLLLGALAPSALLAVLNSKPSSFRYYLPMYPFLVLAAAGLLHHLLVHRPAKNAEPGNAQRDELEIERSRSGVSERPLDCWPTRK
jgi:hypothetical protein